MTLQKLLYLHPFKNISSTKISVLFDVIRVNKIQCLLDCWMNVLRSKRQKNHTNMFSLLQRLEYHTPMSFEQALAMGRTGVLPSPVLNGYKPKGLSVGIPTGRHSDSDEEDWC